MDIDTGSPIVFTIVGELQNFLSLIVYHRHPICLFFSLFIYLFVYHLVLQQL